MYASKIVQDSLSEPALQNEDASKHIHDFSRKLLCIEYPGIVEDVDKMMETFGGKQSLEMAIGNRKKHVELRFRPDDIYCKPCYGEKEKKPGILLKVKVRRPISNLNKASSSKMQDENLEVPASYEYEVIGITAMTIKFKRLCDFQYLPLLTGEKETPSTPLNNIHEKIFPENLPDLSYLKNTESKNMLLFFPPSIFSRYTRPIDNIEYDKFKVFEESLRPEIAERYKARSEKFKKQLSEKTVISNIRKARPTFSLFIKYEDPVVPSGPPPEIPSLEDLNLLGELKKMKQLFEERPIWSKTGLQHRSQIGSNKLKQVIAHVAYHMMSGPWRVMWIRFGYDPRKDPNARIYQTFDYRIRSTGLKMKVQTRGFYKVSYGYHGDTTDLKKFSLEDHLFEEARGTGLPTEDHYILRPGVIPLARQIFYQFCDLQLPEIQSMLARLPPVPTGATCHPKNGWLPEDFVNQCREIANKYILAEVKKQIREEKKTCETKLTNREDIHPSTSDANKQQSDVNQSSIIDTDTQQMDIDLVDDEEDGYDTIDGNLVEGNIENDNTDESDNADEELSEDVNKLLEDIIKDTHATDISSLKLNEEFSKQFQKMILEGNSEDSDIDSDT